VLYGFVDALPLLLVLRALTGVGEAALFVAAATLIADLSPAHRQAEASSYFSVAVYGGIGLGPLLGDTVVHHSDFRTAFVVAGGCAAAAALVSTTVPDSAALARHTTSQVPTPQPPSGPAAPPSIDLDGTGRAAFIHPAALGPGIVLAFSTASFAAFTAFVPDHATALGLSGSGAIFAAYSVVCLVLRLAGAKLPERFGPRRSVTIAFVATGFGLALLAAVPEVGALWVAAVAIGIGAAFTYPSLMALTISRAGDADRPQAIASFTMFFEIGTAVGGLVLGALADSFGKRTGFAAAVVVCAAGAWIVRNIVVPAPAPAPAPFTDAGPPPTPVTAVRPMFAPAAGD
jgi:MFS family permease